MRYIKIITILWLSVASLFAYGEDKIAVIDMQQAMFASQYAQDVAKDASESADFVALRAKAESSAADLQTMAKEAETKRLTWSTEEAAEHQKKMSYAKADYDLAVQKIQGDTGGELTEETDGTESDRSSTPTASTRTGSCARRPSRSPTRPSW